MQQRAPRHAVRRHEAAGAGFRARCGGGGFNMPGHRRRRGTPNPGRVFDFRAELL